MNYKNNYLSENISVVSSLGSTTELCIMKSYNQLLVRKTVPLDCLEFYKLLQQIDNPHIPKILYINESGESLHIYREYISGEPLRDILEKEKKLNKTRAGKYANDICNGLAAMHKTGLIHRDINPNNVIISSDDVAKIIDFGIMRRVRNDAPSDTVIMGTPGFAAPEQFGFAQSDAATDIYALGVLLNIMLTGKLPNEELAGGRLGSVVRKAVEIDSKKRYRSVIKLRSAIGNSGSVGGADKLIDILPGYRSRNSMMAVIATVAYILLFVLSVLWFITCTQDRIPLVRAIASWLLIIPVPFVLFTDFLGLWNIVPFTRNSSMRAQIIFYFNLAFMSISLGTALAFFQN